MYKMLKAPDVAIRKVRIFLFESIMRPLLKLFPRKHNERNILFNCSCALMAGHLSDIWRVLKVDPRLNIFLYDSFRNDVVSKDYDYIYKTLPMARVKRRWAYVRQWDLMITVDHSRKGLLDKTRCPILRARHGVASGKVVAGTTTTFGPKMYTDKNEIRYSKMFAVSHKNKSLAVGMNSEFNDIVKVVGDLRADKMLAMNSDRELIRQRLGFKAEEKVVFVLSTWGPDALFAKMGDVFLAEARKLIPNYRFVLSAHPHQYIPNSNGERVWGEYVRTQSQYGFDIREPQDDWMPFMVACDVIFTDQTSLAVHGALLKKPYVYSSICEKAITEGFLPWRLREISPKINDKATNLGACLNEALTAYPYEKLAKIAEDVNSYPGRAAERIREEIYEMLKLDLKEYNA